MDKIPASTDESAAETPTSSALTIRKRQATKQKLPQIAVTPPTSSPRSSSPGSPKASNNANPTRPRKDHTPPRTTPRHSVTPVTPVIPKPITPKTVTPETATPKPVTPHTMTPNPMIPTLAENADPITRTRKMKHEAAFKAQIEDLKRQVAERDAQIMWLKVELGQHVARHFFG